MRHILLCSVAAGLLAAVVVAQQGPRTRHAAAAVEGAASKSRAAKNARRVRRSCASALPGAGVPAAIDCRLPARSSLVIDQHPVPRAKFPVVDIHSHTGPTPATIASLIAQMDALNIRVLNNLSGGSGDALAQRVRYIKSTPYANRFTVFANGLNQFRGVAPGYGRTGRGAARSRREERRDRSEDLQRDRHGHDRRPTARGWRSTIRSCRRSGRRRRG